MRSYESDNTSAERRHKIEKVEKLSSCGILVPYSALTPNLAWMSYNITITVRSQDIHANLDFYFNVIREASLVVASVLQYALVKLNLLLET